MLVKNIMKKEVATCGVSITLRDAAKQLTRGQVGCLIAMEGENIKGIITKSDIVRCIADKKDVDLLRVGDVMRKDVKSCESNISDHEAAKILSENRVKRLIVTNNGKLEGVISISELVPALNKDVEEISALFWK